MEVLCVLEKQEGTHIRGSFEICRRSKIVNRFAGWSREHD